MSMAAYKNKTFTQRGKRSKPWTKKDQNTKQGGMRFDNTYCKVCKRTNHATKDCHTKSNFKNYQPVGVFLAIWQKKLDDVLASGLEIHVNYKRFSFSVLFFTRGPFLESPKTLSIVQL